MLDKRLLGLIIIVGLVAGLIGSFYTHLLHYIQHFMYAYSTSDGLTFGQAVARVSPEHRLLALLACGLVGGVGWVLIHRYGDPLVDIKSCPGFYKRNASVDHIYSCYIANYHGRHGFSTWSRSSTS